jgi:simple sugar transport system substrate-binding protein
MSTTSGRLQKFLLLCLLGISLGSAACSPRRAQPDFDFSNLTLIPTLVEEPTPVLYTFGLILSGPYNDQGWNQAHYLAGTYVEAKLPDTKMIYVDLPNLELTLAAQKLKEQGAHLVIFTSSQMAESGLQFARANPNIYVVIIGGDQAWPSGYNYAALPNLSNIAGRMEYGQMIAGCAAALTTQTGTIGYLGLREECESRRLAASAFLGAKYCWQTYRAQDPALLKFVVTPAGEPAQKASDLYASGVDVLILGDGAEQAVMVAQMQAAAGGRVWVIPYDSIPACKNAPQTCLGVPYFNWGPAYVTAVKSAQDGNWQPAFRWNGPDWADINESDTSAIGFFRGQAISPQANIGLDRFIEELAFGLNLWIGPLNLSDGVSYLPNGQIATDEQVWYFSGLLQGMSLWP